MLAVLKVLQGPDQGKSHSFGRQQKVTIGRGTTCSICLTDPQASRQHCEVIYDGDKVLITDTGSGTGTLVNGAPIHSAQDLHPGDLIVIGQSQITFQWSDADQKPTEAWDGSRIQRK